MTQWQKFKYEVKDIFQNYWLWFSFIPHYIYIEFNRKLNPPLPLDVIAFTLSLILVVCLFIPNIIFLFVYFILAPFISILTIFDWFKEINTNKD